MSNNRTKSLFPDASNILQFNVGNENIRMKKLISSSSTLNASQKIYYSIVQKQSQSGMSFNRRLFFLRDQHSFGYLSKPDGQLNIKNAKQTIPLRFLRKVIPKASVMTLVFQMKLQKDGKEEDIGERKYVFRMKDKKMTDAWTDIINYQVGQIPSRKTTVEKQQSNESLHRGRQLSFNYQQKQQLQKPLQKVQNTNHFQSPNNKQSPSKKIQQQPIANQRPQLDYMSAWKNTIATTQQKPPNRELSAIKLLTPKSDKIEIEDSLVKSGIYQDSGDKNKNINKISDNKNRYQQFLQINRQLKQTLIYPSFLNYFQPYIPQIRSSSVQQTQKINIKLQQFHSYCYSTCRQLIDNSSLNDFLLINKFIKLKQSLLEQNYEQFLVKEYQRIFNKKCKMSIKAVQDVFQNLIFVSLQDIQVIVPLIQLKQLTHHQHYQQPNHNRICQNILIQQFQHIFLNQQYAYDRLIQQQQLQQYFHVPMRCIVNYKGFKLFFFTKIDQKMYKITSQSKMSTKSINKQKQKQPIKKSLYSTKKVLQSTKKGLQSTKNGKQPIQNGKQQTQKGKQQIKNQQEQKLNENYLLQRLAQTLLISSQALQSMQIIKIIRLNKNYIITSCNILPIPNKIFTTIHTQKQSLIKSQSQMNRKPPNNPKTTKKKNKNKMLYNHLGGPKQNQEIIQLYNQELDRRIKQFAVGLDRLELMVIHPYQFRCLLEQYGIQYKHLSNVLALISPSNTLIRSLLKTQIASECFCLISNKKLQQTLLQHSISSLSVNQKTLQLQSVLKTLLNILLSPLQKQSQSFWKVLTLHSQLLYFISLDKDNIHKGYFVMALVWKMNINIMPATESLNNVFMMREFLSKLTFNHISQQNTQTVNVTNQFLNHILQMTQQQIQIKKEKLANMIIDGFSLKNNKMPQFIKRNKLLYNKILNIMTCVIPSSNQTFLSLKMYQFIRLNFSQVKSSSFSILRQVQQPISFISSQVNLSINTPNPTTFHNHYLLYYRRLLSQFNQNLSTYQDVIQELMIFFPAHVFYTQVFNLQVQKHLKNSHLHNALSLSKKSITNMINVLQGNTSHIAMNKCFFNIANVYKAMGKVDDALAQMKRAKNCLQINNQANTLNYAIILIQISKLNLHLNKDEQALQSILSAKTLLQSIPYYYTNFDLLVKSYQILDRCMSSLSSSPSLLAKLILKYQIPQQSPRQKADKYITVLENVLLKQLQQSKTGYQQKFCGVPEMQTIVKLSLEQYFKHLNPNATTLFDIYVIELVDSIHRKGISYNQQAYDRESSDEQSQLMIQHPVYPRMNQIQSTYNFIQSLKYIKELLLRGVFTIQLSQYLQNCLPILSSLKQQIKLNNSQASKLYILRNSKAYMDGLDQSSISLGQSRQQDMDSLTNRRKGQLNDPNSVLRRFDSFMKAVTVFLGDGWMLHFRQ